MSDVAMLGDSGFELVEGQFYPTPPEYVDCLVAFFRVAEPGGIWEPACGEGHISIRLTEHGALVVSTDLYDRGFGVSGVDFLASNPKSIAPGYRGPKTIVTNPPYGDLAAQFIRKALELMERCSGRVALFLRNEFDCRKNQALFSKHPAYAGKVVVTKRPRWIAGSKGSPRHNYAWYIWDFGRDPQSDQFIKYIHPSEAPSPRALAA